MLDTDPTIRMIEATGYPSARYLREPRCPICGDECETLYKDINNEVCGCDRCITTADAWEEMQDE